MKNYKEIEIILTKQKYEETLKDCERDNENVKKHNKKMDLRKSLYTLSCILLCVLGTIIMGYFSAKTEEKDLAYLSSFLLSFMVSYILHLILWLSLDYDKSVWKPCIQARNSHEIREKKLKEVEFYKIGKEYSLIMENKSHEISQFLLAEKDYDIIYRSDLKIPIVDFSQKSISLPYNVKK